MDAANLIDKFKCRGLKLVLAEGKVRVFPRKLLTDDDRVQIKKFKDDLLYLLSRRQAVEPPVTTPVITSTTLRAPAAEAGLELPAPAEGSFIPSTGASTGRQWECVNRYCLHQVRWWMSKYGVVQCANCKPPGFPDLVVAEGDAANAPAVEPDCFRQAVGHFRTSPAIAAQPSAVKARSACEAHANLAG